MTPLPPHTLEHAWCRLSTRLLRRGATAAAALAMTGFAAAQPAGGPPQGPPPEALAACKSLASGAVCSFSGHRGVVSGTCFAPRQGLALACRPKDAPPPPEPAASGPKR